MCGQEYQQREVNPQKLYHENQEPTVAEETIQRRFHFPRPATRRKLKNTDFLRMYSCEYKAM